MADYWQLEENTDRWQLEENTDLWLLEESGGVSGPLNVSPAMLANPACRIKQAGFVGIVHNLLLTTLAVTATLVARDPLYSPRPQVKAAQQPTALANLNTTTLSGGAPVQAPFVPWQQPARVAAKTLLQPTVPPNNLVSNLAQQGSYYFLNDSGFSVQVTARKAQPTYENRLPLTAEPQADPPPRNDLTQRLLSRFVPQAIASPNLSISTLFDPGKPPRSMDPQVPVRATYINRFDQQNGTIQLLTFVAPPLPKNFFDWQLPKPIQYPPARLDTYQGQNPDMITPAPPVTASTDDYIVRHRHRRSRR